MFELCMKAYFGLLSNGLTYSTNVILTYFQNQQIQFQGSKRTLDYLTGAMKDDRTIRLTEIKDFILDNFFIDFKDRATSITQNYYSQLIDQYSTLYGIFIVCMVFLILFFFIYLYNGIRDTMWRTNLSLKIMPMDFIPREHLADLKAFFNT